MSHFSTLVLIPGDTAPDEVEDKIASLMAPFHEFECTGEDDQYVQNVDITDKARREYTEGTVKRLRTPAGGLLAPWADEFFRDPTPEEMAKIGPIAGTGAGNGMSWSSRDWGDGRGYRTKIHAPPPEYEEVDVPRAETETFREYVEGWYGTKAVLHGQEPDVLGAHKYGFIRLDPDGDVAQVVDRTNPNAKWDWWQIGGRWTGRLDPSYNPDSDPANAEACYLCGGTGHRTDEIGMAARGRDSAYTCNGCNGVGRRTKWPTQWKRFAGDIVPVTDLSPETLNEPTFAVVTPNGVWRERGKMGWWACVSNERDADEWATAFRATLAEHCDAIAVVVDCHI